MIQDSNMTFILQSKVPCGRSTETVPGGTKTSNTLCFQSCNYSVNSRDPRLGAVLSNPSIAMEIGSIEVDDGIVVKDIGSNGPVAVPGKVVNQKLYRHDDVIENK